MKPLSVKIGAFFLVLTLHSCHCYRNEQNSIVIEEYFPVEILDPSDGVRKKIEDTVSCLITKCPVYYNDTLFFHIECYANWNVPNNEDPLSIKVISIDTSWFYLTFNEGMSTEIIMDWRIPTDRTLLSSIKTILESGTYSLYCINHEDISPEMLLSSFMDTLAVSKIDCVLFLTR